MVSQEYCPLPPTFHGSKWWWPLHQGLDQGRVLDLVWRLRPRPRGPGTSTGRPVWTVLVVTSSLMVSLLLQHNNVFINSSFCNYSYCVTLLQWAAGLYLVYENVFLEPGITIWLYSRLPRGTTRPELAPTPALTESRPSSASHQLRG